MVRSVHAEHLEALALRRTSDGGFPPSARGPAEVESTVLAGLALGGDPAARAWLLRRQRADGGFGEASGRHDGPTSAALAALLLEGAAARRALAFAVSHRGRPLPGAGDERAGWGWTADTRSFVEPTSRVLIAANVLTPSDELVRGEATRVLRTWQCADNGWNHGVATVLGDDLTGYAQTTAIALIALRSERAAYVRRALEFLRSHWRREAGRLAGIPGVLVQGELDLGNLVGTPWLLQAAYPGSELVLVPDAGHDSSDPMADALVTATDRFRD